ncbi:MAG: hypothetical protein WDN28_11885 [Chthoniobacter sp.]
MIAGNLLAKYCPENGPRNSAMLWLGIALTATLAPVGLIALRRYIRAPEAGRDDSRAKAETVKRRKPHRRGASAGVN